MTRPTILPAVVAATLLAATAAPAFAVAIKHTSRVSGDPDAAPMPRTGFAAPPVDTTVGHAFDKSHETGSAR